MILVGIDIGKNKHFFSMVDKETGEILSKPSHLKTIRKAFSFLLNHLAVTQNQIFL